MTVGRPRQTFSAGLSHIRVATEQAIFWAGRTSTEGERERGRWRRWWWGRFRGLTKAQERSLGMM